MDWFNNGLEDVFLSVWVKSELKMSFWVEEHQPCFSDQLVARFGRALDDA
jgi:hypothetical protein